MARPYWSGQIQISLVSFGVKLFVATEAKGEIRFHQISRKTGERVRHQKVLASALEQAPDEAAAPVEKDEIIKGYEYRKGEYIAIEPSELEQLRVPSKHTIEVTQFVGVDELEPEYLEKPYFVVPENDMQTEAFAVVRKALRKTKKAALGKIAFGGREHVIAITAPEDDKLAGMMAYTMRYQEELRDPAEYFREIKKVAINEDSLELAETLIKKKSAKFDPAKFTDGYEAALKELVEAKIKHAPVPKDETSAPRRGNVINLMDALRKSVSGGESKESWTTKKKPAARSDHDAGLSLIKPSAKSTTASNRKRKSA
ncbi:non-homologous end joining protein Ku [Edaphobacter dinghuensis]|uniref:Non-homologous end joining protein Ku n=1 Tax=Edaphobacter dinghuensis TaxID=1560005 RepID=A0A917HBL8_9BACT|nr:Ku protein [Edaphobacter dinghuensis]GGG73610.1 non-homologous end joining protein Ku [Edaphobacter dinghuensis]